MVPRDITLDDMKHVKLPVGATPFDALLATAARAKEILEEEEEKKKKKRTPASQGRNPISPYTIRADNGRQGEPPLPQEFKNVIARGRNAPPPAAARMPTQKKLFKTDTSEGHNRLSIPMGEIEGDFQTEGEKRHLARNDENKKKKKFAEVTILEPSSVAPETVKLRRGEMPKKNGGKPVERYCGKG